jgi:integrase
MSITSFSEKRARVTEAINNQIMHTTKRRVCVSNHEAKNLAAVEPQINGSAGVTKSTKNTIKETIFQYTWWMKKEGYAKTTILTRKKLLAVMVKRGANLFDPESVKAIIAEQSWCNKRKINASDAYSCFLRMHNKTWNPPRYKISRTLPFIPTEKEIDQLIAGCHRNITPLLQLLKETGMRIGETSKLLWTDIDYERRAS